MQGLLTFLFLPFLMLMSWWMLLTPFGWMRIAPLVAAFAAVLVFQRKRWLLALGFGWWAFLTYSSDLLGWLLSKRDIAPGHAVADWVGAPSMYMAGFPIHRLEVPPPPMGADIPPIWEWWVVAVNLAFWATLVGIVVWRYGLNNKDRFRRFEPSSASRIALWLVIGSFLVNQMTCGMFMLWFD